ncbi:hypothetical protein [Pseudalkalibacillus caeni]|uniref:Lipoprotein n=1 Tax=Exobacillus caeni TaxID=2574798 RepID=A0A5R9F099_9BACL|nr:hypothetical protein [Pseudalkalibacillus caeni]TLS35856.1 hypothetical protein FCL54_17820 [Pseudalkalibacillus caeni]
MKKTLLALTLFLIGVIGAGCSSDSSPENNKLNGESPLDISVFQNNDMISGIETVISSVEKLNVQLESAEIEIKEVNRLGKEIEANWDRIEDQVEKRFPADYKNIEASLYPLIDVSKETEPDLDKLKQLVKDTEKKLVAFKDKLAQS